MTPKQEHFARLFVETGNASEAYRQAYNAENMKPETITNEAYKLLQDPDITAMIDGLKAEHRARHAVTVDDVIAELEQARQKALNAPTPQSGAAVSASMGKAKILGLIVDKSEIKAEVKEAAPPKEKAEITGEQIGAINELYREKKLNATMADIIEIVGKDPETQELHSEIFIQAVLLVYAQSIISA
ncbi:terminase small subunit [Neisseria sp. Dent CA1/247]|uniref:terminase small subunit n=1 Tax=Neisseria sp. Dent CA1/247 TaxID=2912675 RepID=UPI001FD01214|nr:terminase small subunit [Neisseria sp. Dent CA1/247]UOO77737.1 terminase small subunit [Neisseria sp. Dent CA1/247]